MTISADRFARARATGAALLSLVFVVSCGHPAQVPRGGTASTSASRPTTSHPPIPPPAPVEPEGDFTAVPALVNADIAAHRLPGAVVQVGHDGRIVFRQAFGDRKLPGEPGLDGAPGPAEPMTEDTIFDLASLSKPLATTPAVLQLYEQGKVGIDDPVQKYLPEFNPANDPRRAQVTVRMLLTHTSGIAGDLSHDGPWGLTAADKDDGVRRALAARVEFPPGEVFHYSDIGFILLGALVERVTGEPLDVYVHDNVFVPIGMNDTWYLPASRACGPHRILGNAMVFDPGSPSATDCAENSWSTDLLARVAPTAHDEDTPGINPDFDRLLRGTVHDPTARRMGGVAGSAGVFSTAGDVGKYAQALLDRLAGRPSPFPLKQSTVEMMTTPQQPGHDAVQLAAANNAENRSGEPRYPAVAGENLRGFGWDIDTAFSRPRGLVFPVGSFGQSGFTGVSLWMDPGSDCYVVVLANVIHQRGGPPIVTLSGDIATAAGRALHLYGS